ncbi:hypothetical protein [Tersicoccus phoenicis]|uniref:hypothetical protein n=1 Tax=Tersicoccus phoenicis TaxID=554083 RepID=UPI00117F3344|nr:hypothetical protein [Tersicoccus phoenicis]
MKLVELLGVTSISGYKSKAYYAVVGIVLVTLGAIASAFHEGGSEGVSERGKVLLNWEDVVTTRHFLQIQGAPFW